MSYCRWSSDNWKSDVYVYEDVGGGWTIHVAGNKTIEPAPTVPALGSVSNEEWLAAHKVQMAFLNTAPRKSIGLSHDGQSFNEDDIPTTISRLLELRSMGYHVPEYALESLRDELTAESENET